MPTPPNKKIKRLKRDAPPSFNKKSNEDQYKATKCVLEAVEDASSSLERRDLPKTKEHLEKGMSLLKKRQKLILLADKSPYGWKTDLEYKQLRTTKMRRRSIEPKPERPELPNVLLPVVPIPSVAGLLLHDLPSLLLLTFRMLLVG